VFRIGGGVTAPVLVYKVERARQLDG